MRGARDKERHAIAASAEREAHRCSDRGLGRRRQGGFRDDRDDRITPVVGWSCRKITGRPSDGTCTDPRTTPSLGSSPCRARSSGGPSVRSPMRLLCGETRYVAEVRVRSAAGVNQSARGPGRTGSTSSTGGPGQGAATGGATGRAGVPTGTTSPSRRGPGPRPESRSVERLPRTGSAAMPPATATYERTPAVAAPTFRTAPAGTRTGAPQAADRPSTVTGQGAPPTTTVTARSGRRAQPVRVVSRTAAPGSLPSSRLARRMAGASRAPERGTPRWAWPRRPASCTVVRAPERTVVSLAVIPCPPSGRRPL